jgi:shikimate kinase
MKIFLIGMPFSGKSTIAQKLGVSLGIKSYDLDELITSQEELAIAKIFEQRGEDYFREIEQKVLSTLILTNENFVLACGGGTPCYFDNLSQMKSAGITIYLDVPVNELYERARQSDINLRPLLFSESDEDLLLKMERLHQSRDSIYRNAAYTVQGNNIDVKDIVNLIKASKADYQ